MREREILPDVEPMDQAENAPVFGNERDPVCNGVGRRPDLDGLTPYPDLTAVSPREPENRLREPGSPRSHQPVDAQDFAAVYLKAHVFKVGSLCKVGNLQDCMILMMLSAAGK